MTSYIGCKIVLSLAVYKSLYGRLSCTTLLGIFFEMTKSSYVEALEKVQKPATEFLRSMGFKKVKNI